MFIELCIGNYIVFDSLVNGADGLFKALAIYFWTTQ
jgi:hypothetical protein